MNRRIEFSLNLDNPAEAALYEALAGLLRHRRAGEVIRQALTAYLMAEPANARRQAVQTTTGIAEQPIQSARQKPDESTSHPAIDDPSTRQVVARSAEMFGF